MALDKQTLNSLWPVIKDLIQILAKKECGETLYTLLRRLIILIIMHLKLLMEITRCSMLECLWANLLN